MASDVRKSPFEGLEDYLDDEEDIFDEPCKEKEEPLYTCSCHDSKIGWVETELYRDFIRIGNRTLRNFVDIIDAKQENSELIVTAFVDPPADSMFNFMNKRLDPKILNGDVIEKLKFESPEACWEFEILASAMIRDAHQQFFETFIRRNQSEYFQYWCKAAKLTSSGIEQGRDLFLSNKWLYLVHMTHPANVTSVKWALPLTTLYSLVLDTIHEQHSVLIVFDSREVLKLEDSAHTFEKGVITGDSKRFIFGNARSRAILVKEIQRLYWKLSKQELLVQVDDDSASVSNSEPGRFGGGSPRVLTGKFYKLRKAGLFAKAMKHVKWIPIRKTHGLIEWSDPNRGGKYERHIVVAASEDQSLLSGRLDDASLEKLFIVTTEKKKHVAFITNTKEEKKLWLDALSRSGVPLKSIFF